MKLQASRGIKVKEGFIYIIALTICLGTAKSATAATHIVLPGTSIQAKINAATAGDTIIIKGGTYGGEHIVIDNKVLDLRPAQGESVNITGPVTLQNIMGTMNLANFRIGGNSGHNLAINNCTKVYVDFLDLSTSGGGLDIDNHTFVQVNSSTFGNSSTIDTNCTIYCHNATLQNVTANNSKVTLRKCPVREVNVIKSQLHMLGCTIADGYNVLTSAHAADDYGRVTELVLLQNYFLGGSIRSSCAKGWIAYNRQNMKTNRGECIQIDSGSKVFVVHNIIQNWGSSNRNGIWVDDAGTEANIYNNIIHNTHTGGANHDTHNGIYLYNGSPKATIVNNIITGWRANTSSPHRSGNGIYVGTTSGTKIYGNIFWECNQWPDGTYARGHAIWAPFANVHSQHNGFNTERGNLIGGGVVDTDSVTISGNPFVKFTDWANSNIQESSLFDFRLGAGGSAYVNKGPAEAQFNDHDASRNDIGTYGGHKYDVNGLTTTKPITLSAELDKIQLLRGTDTTITIKSRGAVVTP